MAALRRVTPRPGVCEKHHPINWVDEFNNVRRRLRALRLALVGGPIHLREVGMEGDPDENHRDALAVLEVAEELEERMDAFKAERDQCPVCSPEGA